MEIDLRFVIRDPLPEKDEEITDTWVRMLTRHKLQWRKGVKVGSLSADGVDWGEWEDVPLVRDE